MDKQLFYIEYGCGCGQNCMIIQAKSQEAAIDYAYEKAVEDYESYEGLHGIPSREDVAEEHEIEDSASDEVEEIYIEERESWLDYCAEPYDAENTDHSSAIEDGVWEI